jgi:PAS domain S-box-containing protein
MAIPSQHDNDAPVGQNRSWPEGGPVRAAGTEEALRKQTEVLQSILDSMADAVAVADQDERFLMFNRACERMFGMAVNMTADEWSQHYGLYQTDMVTLYPADELPLRRAVRGEEVNDVEIFVRPHLAPEGFWILVNGRPLRDATGGLRGGVVVCHDITERYRAAQALRRSAEELASSNAQLRQLTTDLEEAGLARQKAYQELERAYHDLKRAEAQLIQAEKLSTLGQLIAGVAHEINNPLAYVANNVAVLRRDAEALRDLLQTHQRGMETLAAHHPELHAQIAEQCDRIDLEYTLDGLEKLLCRSGEGLQRIQQIVRDLRDFARLDEPDRLLVDLNDGIRSTVNIISGHAKKHGVALAVELGALPLMHCYPGKINQVVMNLLANAIDASEPGKQVTLRTCAAAPAPAAANGSGVAPGPGGIEIHVIDNGRGIEPAVRGRIFEAFFTTKPPGQGTGLGLSISAGIVQAHQGRIDVDSVPGQGTHITVFLPSTGPSAPPAGPAATPPEQATPPAGMV